MTRSIPTTAGFTLVEMAIVLLIVALAIGGGLSVFSAQVEVQKVKETQSALEDAKEALIGYAATHLATDTRPLSTLPGQDRCGRVLELPTTAMRRIEHDTRLLGPTTETCLGHPGAERGWMVGLIESAIG
ncbi:MAG: type II secretion system protein [Sulfuritalea sp.]|nr:type II secretion system protein [Sulfuritalea sp.]